MDHPEQLVDEYQQVDTPVHHDTGPNGPPMPVGQEHADTILADIEHQAALRHKKTPALDS